MSIIIIGTTACGNLRPLARPRRQWAICLCLVVLPQLSLVTDYYYDNLMIHDIRLQDITDKPSCFCPGGQDLGRTWSTQSMTMLQDIQPKSLFVVQHDSMTLVTSDPDDLSHSISCLNQKALFTTPPVSVGATLCQRCATDGIMVFVLQRSHLCGFFARDLLRCRPYMAQDDSTGHKFEIYATVSMNMRAIAFEGPTVQLQLQNGVRLLARRREGVLVTPLEFRTGGHPAQQPSVLRAFLAQDID